MEEYEELELRSVVAINSTLLNITKWKLSDDINGHILAFFFLIELILAVIFNFYIIMHSIFFRKRNFTRSSTILLFNLALSDLVMMLFYVPFSVVASSFGEWIFGRTDYVRNIFCQIHGFIFFQSCTVSTYTLAAISIDRFFYIVKGEVYHKWMSVKVADCMVAIIWVNCSLFCCLLLLVFFLLATARSLSTELECVMPSLKRHYFLIKPQY